MTFDSCQLRTLECCSVSMHFLWLITASLRPTYLIYYLPYHLNKLISNYKLIVCGLRNYNFISKEKFEPGLGFEPWTSKSLVWCSTIWAIQVQLMVQIEISLLKEMLCKAVDGQMMTDSVTRPITALHSIAFKREI